MFCKFLTNIAVNREVGPLRIKVFSELLPQRVDGFSLFKEP
jgi:hypothetical protein